VETPPIFTLIPAAEPTSTTTMAFVWWIFVVGDPVVKVGAVIDPMGFTVWYTPTFP